MQIGAQFYTLRDFCKTPEGLAESLRKVADIGYRTVQISGTCAYDARWLKEELDKNGLKCVLTHIPVPRLTGETEQVIADHRVFGCGNVGLGFWGFSDERDHQTWERWQELFVPVAKKLHEAGLYFMYHNHDNEFRKAEDGEIYMQKLAEILPADTMGFTLDTFWVQVGGGDPSQWLEKLAGRIPCIHLKDYAFGRSMAVVGEGNLNWDRIFQKAEEGGTQYMLVEQDDCHGEDPFDCLRRSYDFLRANGFE